MSKLTIRLIFILGTIAFCFLGLQNTFVFGGFEQFATEPGVLPEAWSWQELNQLSAIAKIALFLILCLFTLFGYKLIKKFQVNSVINALVDYAAISIVFAMVATWLIRQVPFDFFSISALRLFIPTFNQVLTAIFFCSILSFFLGLTIWVLEEGVSRNSKLSSFKINGPRIWISFFLLYAFICLILFSTISAIFDNDWFSTLAFSDFINIMALSIYCTICSWSYFFIFPSHNSIKSTQRWILYGVFCYGLIGWIFLLFCISMAFDFVSIDPVAWYGQWIFVGIQIALIVIVSSLLRKFNWFGYKESIDLSEKTAELSLLKSQINPHFLFNSLNSIYGIAIEEQSPKTAEGVQKLSEMMRFMLKENTEDKIGLEKEINYINNYIDLQRLRVDENENTQIDVAINSACEGEITPMLLIPFIENAFKHGISLQELSWIRIELTCTRETVSLEVENSIHKKQFSQADESGIGLENVKERLKLLYPEKHQLEITSDEKAYFVSLNLSL